MLFHRTKKFDIRIISNHGVAEKVVNLRLWRLVAEAARAVNARAFTVGQDVMFGAGQYASGASGGRRLMAHELTQVV